MTTLKDAFDGAQYVKFINDYAVAVWHGGHTINYYHISFDRRGVSPHEGTAKPFTCQSIGDFETGEVTLEEAKEAIENFELEE